MLSPDVIVLVRVFREDAEQWIEKALADSRRLAVSELVLNGTLKGPGVRLRFSAWYRLFAQLRRQWSSPDLSLWTAIALMSGNTI